MPTSVALLGAGIFAREEYIPALKSGNKFSLKAIYSRSKKSADGLASQVSSPVDLYYDSPGENGKSLDDLLARSDIEAVIICLPITVQPEVIKRALAAGKHVLSEKPIAPTAQAAQDLSDYQRQYAASSIWMVAENFRYLDPLVYGHSKMKEIGGDLVTFHVNVFTLIDDNDKFYQTEWRQVPEYQGGFLLDGGVHFIAGLRYLLSGVGQDVASLAAYTALVQPKLAPTDTMHAILATGSGRSGTFSVSFGAAFQAGFEIEVVTTKGRVTVTPTAVTTVHHDGSGQKQEHTEEFKFASGVANEVEAFAASIEARVADARAAPQQAAKDLEILQSMLESGKGGGVLKKIVPCLL